MSYVQTEAIINNEAKSLELNFDFLGAKKKYRARIYQDDENVKTKTWVALKDVEIKKGSKMKLNLLVEQPIGLQK